MNIKKDWKEIEKQAKVTLDDWEELKSFIYKLVLRIEDLEKSRDNWKGKYKELKEKKIFC